MNEATARKHLKAMLARLTPGSVLHLLGEVIRQAESDRRGDLDESARERITQAEAALIVMGLGLDAILPR